MAILKIANMGHPVLRVKSAFVTNGEIRSESLQKLVDDMVASMIEYDGVGLAAPQVHVSKRIIMAHSEDNPRYPGSPDIPLTMILNPVMIGHSSEEEERWEGCLSVPGLRGLVPRYRKVAVKGLSRTGKSMEIEAEGFMAVVIQHEMDHLEGILFPDRVLDLKYLVFQKEYERFHQPAEDTKSDTEEGKRKNEKRDRD